MEYEYKIVADCYLLECELNRLGRKGWELCTWIKREYVFKRLIVNNK